MTDIPEIYHEKFSMLMTGSKATGPSRRVQNEEETENFEFKNVYRGKE